MSILNKELINYQNKLYWIYRKVKLNHIKEGFVNEVKSYWNCDLVIRNRNLQDETLFFLREISDVELIY